MRVYRKKIFRVGLGCVALTILSNALYRPLIHYFGWNDLGLSHVLPSGLGCMALAFFAWSLVKDDSRIRTSIASTIIGCIIYEIIQPHTGLGVFDLLDIVSILIAGCFVLMLTFKTSRDT